MSSTAELAAFLLPEHGFGDWTVRIEPHGGGPMPPYVGRTFMANRLFAFSAWLDTRPEWVRREIILHEMAHALLGHGYHDDGWRAAATRYGCVLVRDWHD